MSTIYADEWIAPYLKKFNSIKLVKDEGQKADFEFGSSCVFNPLSLKVGKSPNFIKATAVDYMLWEEANCYFPATSNHENFNVIDFNVEHVPVTHDFFVTNKCSRLYLSVCRGEFWATGVAKFGSMSEKLGVVNYNIINCAGSDEIEMRQTAINDIATHALAAYKLFKLKNPAWIASINNAWNRERMEYLYHGKVILADNQIAEMVSVSNVAARPSNNKLLVIFN